MKKLTQKEKELLREFVRDSKLKKMAHTVDGYQPFYNWTIFIEQVLADYGIGEE